MEKFTRFLLEKNLFVHYLTLIIVLIGSFSLYKMRREARPEVNFDRITISVPYNGASATDVEELILKPLEDEIEGIDGIKEYRSSAFEGIGQMSIEIDPDYPEKRDVIDEVQRAVNQTVFPEDALDPVVTEIKASKITVYSFALIGDVDPLELRRAAKNLEDEISDLPGVSSVDMGSLNDLEFRISVKPEVLNNSFLSLTEIMGNLKNWNRVSPAGEVDSGGKNYPIRIDERLDTVEGIENLTIRANDAGIGIKIKEIADVKFQSKELKQELLVNGKSAITLSVIKDESADIITTVKKVKSFLKEYEFPEGISHTVYYDDSVRIQGSLKAVFSNAAFGLILVLGALMFFVSTRLSLVTAIGMPIAFLGGVMMIFFLGMTLNSLVVLGMIVVLGMLVDDAIVVAENIYYHVENGIKPFDAAVKGVSEVAAPVFATVLTTIFAFLPVAYMDGIMGQFLRVIPITVIFILLFSLFEALVILPTHCAEFLKPREKGSDDEKGFIENLRKKYVKFVEWSFSSKWVCTFMVLVFLALVGVTFIAAKSVKFELFPRAGIEFLTINTEFPVNTSKEKSRELLSKLYKVLNKSEVSKDIFSMTTSLGQSSKGGLSGSREQGSHLAQNTLRLTDDPSFVYREKEVVKKIEKIVDDVIKGYDNVKYSVNIPRAGPPVESDIQVLIYSRNFAESTNAVKEVSEFLTKQEGNLNIQTDLMNKVEYYRVQIDKALATESGMQFTDISNSIFSAFYGIAATKTRIGDDEVDLVVSLDKESRQSIENLEDLKFLNSKGVLVPLKSFASVTKDKTLPSIQRLDGKRAISIFGDVDQKVSSPSQANALIYKELPKWQKNHPEVTFEVGGSETQRLETLTETAQLYVFSLIAIFLVISLSFNSIGFPFMVLFAIPFGVIGVVWALFLHNTPLSLMGLVGTVGLSGVVVNGSIILIQFILEEIRSGKGLKSSIITGAKRRFRPIIITSVTTLLGLAPTIYSVGGKDAFIQPLALSLGWGLLVSTVLTLFLMPSFIYILSCKFIKNPESE